MTCSQGVLVCDHALAVLGRSTFSPCVDFELLASVAGT